MTDIGVFDEDERGELLAGQRVKMVAKKNLLCDDREDITCLNY
ncbi:MULTISPECIES: hypothetical protein [unclassified Tychonema]|nr:MULTISPECIES: hypothetical protein [unclassified Tychonema]